MALINRWKFDFDAIDVAGGNNGTHSTTAKYITVSRVQGGACNNFSGVSIRLDSCLDLEDVTNFSISMWIRYKQSTNNEYMLSQASDSSNNARWAIIKTSVGKFRYQIINDAGGELAQTNSSDVTPYVWHHLVMVDANGTITGYLDGQVDAAITDSYTRTALASTNTTFGVLKRISASNSYGGVLDDVRIYDTALSAGAIEALYDEYKPPAWENYALRWTLDNTANEINAWNNGTATDVTYSASRIEGQYSGDFDGNSSGIELASCTDLEDYTNYSLSAWIRAAGPGSYRAILYQQIEADSGAMVIFGMHDNESVRYLVINDAGAAIFSDVTTAKFDDDKWHHVVITDANGTVKAYVDGSIDSGLSGSYTRVALSSDLTTIGYASYDNTPRHYWDGHLDDVRIYTTALSAAEVRSLYNSYFAVTALNLGSNL